MGGGTEATKPVGVSEIAEGTLHTEGEQNSAHASHCGHGKTVTFAVIDWESGAFISEVMKACRKDAAAPSIPLAAIR